MGRIFDTSDSGYDMVTVRGVLSTGVVVPVVYRERVKRDEVEAFGKDLMSAFASRSHFKGKKGVIYTEAFVSLTYKSKPLTNIS